MSHYPLGAAALIAAAVFAAPASPAAARQTPAAASAVCPAPAAASALTLPSDGALEDQIAQLSQVIADLSDRLADLEDTVGGPDDEYGEDSYYPGEDRTLANQPARPPSLAVRPRRGMHAGKARPAGRGDGVEPTTARQRGEVRGGTTT